MLLKKRIVLAKNNVLLILLNPAEISLLPAGIIFLLWRLYEFI